MNFLHNHAVFKEAKEYKLYRSLHLGTRGYAGSEYILVRIADSKRWEFETQRDLKTWLKYNRIEPGFVNSDEWREIKYG